LQALYMSTGASASAAYGAALNVINGLLLRQAYMLAIQDAFSFSLVLAIMAIVASFFVGGSKKNAPTTENLTEEEKEEIKLAREEAMLAG
jgi:hypothetical protein